MAIDHHELKAGVPVRWPFRLLAAVIVLCSTITGFSKVFGNVPMNTPALKWQFLANLPLMAWLVRLAWHAAFRGKSPASACWPFATDDVLAGYFFICLIVTLF